MSHFQLNSLNSSQNSNPINQLQPMKNSESDENHTKNFNHQKQNIYDFDTQLQQIHKQINSLSDQLQHLFQHMQLQQKNQGKYAKFTPSYLTLERQRNNLRKQLIDLDLKQKEIHFKKIHSKQHQPLNHSRQNNKIQHHHLQSHRQNHTIKSSQQNQQRTKIEQSRNDQNLRKQSDNEQSNNKILKRVEFYENSQIAINASRTELQKNLEFSFHNRQFSFSNVNKIESIEMKNPQSAQKKTYDGKYQTKNLFNRAEKINLFQNQQKQKTYEMQARLALQKQKLQKRLKDLSVYNQSKSKEYEIIKNLRYPSHYYGFKAFSPFYYPIRYY